MYATLQHLVSLPQLGCFAFVQVISPLLKNPKNANEHIALIVYSFSISLFVLEILRFL